MFVKETTILSYSFLMLLTRMQHRRNHTIFTLTTLFLAIALLLQPTHSIFIGKDPLPLVVRALQDFTANQTKVLTHYTHQILHLVESFNATLAFLQAFLDAETTRGQRLTVCMEDPASCQ